MRASIVNDYRNQITRKASRKASTRTARCPSCGTFHFKRTYAQRGLYADASTFCADASNG